MYLVTGATGHIGNVLVRKLLERGKKVRALILPGEDTTSLQDVDVERVEGDVLNLDSLSKPFEGVSGIFHLAGVISIMPGPDPIVWRVNVEGTRNVLKAAIQSGVQRLVYTSSIHAIQRVESGVIDERLPYDPGNPYGEYDRSKAQATLEVQQVSREELDAVIACPTGVIGPHDYRGSMMGSVIRTAAENQPTLYVDGAYDFVDVRDVADGLIAASEKGTAGRVISCPGSACQCATCWRPCVKLPALTSLLSKFHSGWRGLRQFSLHCTTEWRMPYRDSPPTPSRCFRATHTSATPRQLANLGITRAPCRSPLRTPSIGFEDKSPRNSNLNGYDTDKKIGSIRSRFFARQPQVRLPFFPSYHGPAECPPRYGWS